MFWQNCVYLVCHITLQAVSFLDVFQQHLLLHTCLSGSLHQHIHQHMLQNSTLLRINVRGITACTQCRKLVSMA